MIQTLNAHLLTILADVIDISLCGIPHYILQKKTVAFVSLI